MTSVIVLVILASLLASPAIAGPAGTAQAGNAQVELVLNKASYVPGEPVEITVTVTNRTGEAITFQFNTSQMFDLMVLREDRPVWQWSHGKAFTQALTALTLNPNESKVFQARWDQRDLQGQLVPAGEYEIVAVFPIRRGFGIQPKPEGPRVRFSIGARRAELTPQPPVVSSRSVTAAGSPIGEVLVNDRPVLRIRAAAGGISAPERAEIVAARLQDLVAQGLTPQELRIRRVGGEIAIMWQDRAVITADANHARLNKTTPRALAMRWLKGLQEALAGPR